jgi:threonine dehydrogenase-like Zn-dependent dehydrogenase
MLAVRFDGAVSVASVDVPSPGAGETRVHVRLAGICSTDLEITRGYAAYRGTLGHEFVGEVDADADPAWAGRRVVAEINAACGACERCAVGLGCHCAARRVVGIRDHDGCFAEALCVPSVNLHAVPDHVPDEVAVFTEPVAAALEILAQVPIPPGDPVVVLGDGKLGLLVAMVLRRHGCDVSVVGRHPRKLAIAAGFGARTPELDALHRCAARWVVEATGSPEGLSRALELVAPRGTIVLKSTFHGERALAMSGIVVDEVTIVGSRCGDFAPAIAALAEGSIDPRPLIDHVLGLQEARDALALAATPGTLKVRLDARR